MAESRQNPNQSSDCASQAADLSGRRANVRCARWGIVSFAFALVFPLAFYGIVTAETARILAPPPSWGRAAVSVALSASSLLAVTLGIVSLLRETPNAWALIGMVVGSFELLLILFAS